MIPTHCIASPYLSTSLWIFLPVFAQVLQILALEQYKREYCSVFNNLTENRSGTWWKNYHPVFVRLWPAVFWNEFFLISAVFASLFVSSFLCPVFHWFKKLRLRHYQAAKGSVFQFSEAVSFAMKFVHWEPTIIQVQNILLLRVWFNILYLYVLIVFSITQCRLL